MAVYNRSTISFISDLDSHKHDEGIGYDEISTKDLREMLKDIVRAKWILKMENGLFERFLARYDQDSLEILTQALDATKVAQKLDSQTIQTVSSVNLYGSGLSLRGKASSSIASIYSIGRYITPSRLANRLLKISLEKRILMANREIEHMTNELHAFANNIERRRVRLSAKLEELELRIRETQAAIDNFEAYVVQKGVDSITGKIPAETFVRFMDNWLKIADTIIDRLRLKTYTIKLKIMKAKQQLVQREELGESLNAVDFEQLRIENQYYVRKIEGKTEYLLDMKKTTGVYSLELTRHKEKLNYLISKLMGIRNEISQNKLQVEKLSSTETFTMNQIKKINREIESLLDLMDKYEVPNTLDFLRVQEDLAHINRIYKRLDRERNIMKITYQTQCISSRQPSKNDTTPSRRYLI